MMLNFRNGSQGARRTPPLCRSRRRKAVVPLPATSRRPAASRASRLFMADDPLPESRRHSAVTVYLRLLLRGTTEPALLTSRRTDDGRSLSFTTRQWQALTTKVRCIQMANLLPGHRDNPSAPSVPDKIVRDFGKVAVAGASDNLNRLHGNTGQLHGGAMPSRAKARRVAGLRPKRRACAVHAGNVSATSPAKPL